MKVFTAALEKVASPYKGLGEKAEKQIKDGFTVNVIKQALGEMQHGEDEQETIDHYAKAVTGDERKALIQFFAQNKIGD